MNKAGCAAVLVASVALAAFAAEEELTITDCSFELRPFYKCPEGDIHFDEGNFKKLGLSGLTYIGERNGTNCYWAVDDEDGNLYPMSIGTGGDGKIINDAAITFGDRVKMACAKDMEGCAYDPASGKVWISQETGALIREYDPKTGAISRTAPVPEVMKNYNENRSLEALTISGNGKVMWTCNEEALKCDGSVSSRDTGTVVRLTRFTRKSVYDNWTPAGQWPYLTEPIGSDPCNKFGFFVDENSSENVTQSGVSGLCLLPNGTLLVLERRCYGDGSLGAKIQSRIYKVDFSDATEISSIKSLKEHPSFKCVTKGDPLWDSLDSRFGLRICNFECMCLGPRLDDNSCVLVLTTDANNAPEYCVLTLKLSGLNVHTLNVRRYTYEQPDGTRVWGFSEQNYRYLDGTPITVRNPGECIEPTAYTNSGDRVFTSEWKLPKHGIWDRKGPTATFNIHTNDTLWWTITRQKDAKTPIYAHDTFEEYSLGTWYPSVKHWTGGCEAVASGYTPKEGDRMRILKFAPHTKVLDATEGAIRSLKTNVNGIQRFRVDIMLEIQRSPKERLEEPPDNPRFAIAADNEGYLNLWYRKCVGNTISKKYDWGRLDDGKNTRFSNGDWVRVSFVYAISSGQAFAKVLVNGDDCSVEGGKEYCSLDAGKGPWFPVSGQDIPTKLALAGTKADDFIMAEKTYIDSVHPSASIMVAPSAASGASGAAALGGQAYTVSTAVPAPVAAPATASAGLAVSAAGPSSVFAVPAPAITGFGITSAKLPRIEFIGYVGGVGYRVLCSSTIDFKNATPIAGRIVETRIDEDDKGVVAVWEGDKPDSPASGAKFYRVEVVGAAAE